MTARSLLRRSSHAHGDGEEEALLFDKRNCKTTLMAATRLLSLHDVHIS